MFGSNKAFAKSCSSGEFLLTNVCRDCPAGCYCTYQGSGDWVQLGPNSHSGQIYESEVQSWCSASTANGLLCDWSQDGSQC